ncbi:MFS transporter [Streptomyces sp. NPDC094038]|uniref:MFS transporter n=1 Tax=Streptomyces sp. NPDC094038 TaxID=3366055 RepID=UPI00382E933B
MSVQLIAPRSVWHLHGFRLLLLDRLLAPAATAVSTVAVSFAVLGLTGSVADLSHVLAAQILPALMLMPVSGVLADRFGAQYVIAAACLLTACCEGTLACLLLTGRPGIGQIMLLEAGTGSALAMFLPASTALLPRLVPDGELQRANAISRLVTNGATVGGGAFAGVAVASFGPGWALAADAAAMLAAAVPNLLIRTAPNAFCPAPGLLGEAREGWREFRSHTWLWVIVLQYSLVFMACAWGYSVLGPVVARDSLGGSAAWGEILVAESLGLVVGACAATRFTTRRPLRFVTLCGAAVAAPTLALALLLPLWLICAFSFGTGVLVELMMVQWNVVMARTIPADRLARVGSYDMLGSVAATPLGALLAGPLAATIGIRPAQFAAVLLAVAVTLLALAPKEIRAEAGRAAANR